MKLTKHRWQRAVLDSSFDAVTKHIALALAVSLFETGPEGSPSIDQIAANTSRKPTTVRNKVLLLEDAGWLDLEQSDGRRYQFILTLPIGAMDWDELAELNDQLHGVGQWSGPVPIALMDDPRKNPHHLVAAAWLTMNNHDDKPNPLTPEEMESATNDLMEWGYAEHLWDLRNFIDEHTEQKSSE